MSRLDDPAWVGTAGDYVATAAAANVSLTTLFAGISAGAQQAHDLLVRAFGRRSRAAGPARPRADPLHRARGRHLLRPL